jgi:secondary thiamine-phosphate synthase enzyme
MKVYIDYLTLQTQLRREYINITPNCRAAVEKSGIHNGLMLVMVLHSNSGIFLGDEEPGLLADLTKWLQTVAPERDDYQHEKKFESNAGIHLQSIALGTQVTLSVNEGKLEFGPWQHVMYAELDGTRPKKIILKVIGE